MQEKETALNMAVDVFCRLVKQHSNVAQLVTKYDSFSSVTHFHLSRLQTFCLFCFNFQLITYFHYRLVEAHIFSFVVGRAFVTDVEKLRMYSKGRSLNVAKVINFFSEVTKVCSLPDLCCISISELLELLVVWMCFLLCVRFSVFQDGTSPGSNLLFAIEVLVSGV